MKYIDADKLKGEIERRIELHDSLASNAESEMIANLEIGAAQALDDLRSFLSTLESEKPMNLVERIGSYNIVPYIDDKIAALQDMWREEKVAFDWDDLKDMIEDVARNFAQWGAEHLADARKTSPKDLEEAAWDCVLDNIDVNNPVLLPKYKELLTYLFIAGAKWQKEQMMKEAVEYEVWDFSSSLEAYPHVNIPLDNKQYRSGDKVRIIIVKED